MPEHTVTESLDRTINEVLSGGSLNDVCVFFNNLLTKYDQTHSYLWIADEGGYDDNFFVLNGTREENEKERAQRLLKEKKENERKEKAKKTKMERLQVEAKKLKMKLVPEEG